MSKLTKATLAKLEGLGDDGKMKVGDFLALWLDPKSSLAGTKGNIGEEFTDKRTGLTRKTTSFHSVLSGFNEAFRLYYDCDSKAVISAMEKAEELRLISVRLVGRGQSGKGVPGARISAYRDSSGRGKSALADLGIKVS